MNRERRLEKDSESVRKMVAKEVQKVKMGCVVGIEKILLLVAFQSSNIWLIIKLIIRESIIERIRD